MKKNILALFLGVLVCGNLIAQNNHKFEIFTLDHIEIMQVNTPTEKAIERFGMPIGEAVAIFKENFSKIGDNQKVALLLIMHKSGKPTIELYSNPKIKIDKEKKLLEKLNKVGFENTQVTDYSTLITLNAPFKDIGKDFKDLILPNDRITNEYEKADLKKKYELNKQWVITTVLPVLAARQMLLEDKFVGIRGVGELITKTNFKEKQNITTLLDNNYTYWRGVVETEPTNELITATKIFALVSQGEFSYAKMLLNMSQLFSDENTLAGYYLGRLLWRLNEFNVILNAEIQKGIIEHDKGNFEKAIAIYNDILKISPAAVLAIFELAYSQNTLDLKTKKMTNDEVLAYWDKIKKQIYPHNPFFILNLNNGANNAQEAYWLFRQKAVNNLFKDTEEKEITIYKYANIALDLGIYDFAAQLFWYSHHFNKKEESLPKFAYCLDKLGVKKLDTMFKMDFKALFKEIEDQKDKEMKESAVYKEFKK